MTSNPMELLAAWGMQTYKSPIPCDTDWGGYRELLMQLGIVDDLTLPTQVRWQAANLFTDPSSFTSLEKTQSWIDMMQGRYDHALLQTDRMITVHRELFALHGFTGVLKPKNWLFYGLLGLLEKYLKHALADLFAVILQQDERPVRPVWAQEGLPWTGGAVVAFKRKCIFRKNRKGKRKPWAVSFGYSLYQSKGGSLQVPTEFVNGALNDMEERVCLDRDLPYTDQYMEDLIDQVTRTVDEVVDDLQVGRGQLTTVPSISKVPSLHSSVQSYRKTMGTQNYIFRNIRATPLNFPVLLGHAGDNLIYGRYDPEDIEHALRQSRLAALSKVGSGVDCEPVPLLEPFKVRVITRGDADFQHLSRRWQSFVFQRISEHPSLQLMKGPIGEEALDFLRSRSNPYDGRKWISADYSAATDNLNPDLSEAALWRLSSRLGIPLEDAYCLRENLTRHNIKCVDGTVRNQQWGQLMGSPVSFYILCLVNLALCRFALELANGTVGDYKLLDLPLLVNGDDAGFRANETEYTVWKAVVESGGLSPSIGKNYSSDEWLILNSQLFHFRVQEKGHGAATLGRFVVKRVPIVCSSLLYCRARSTSALDKDLNPNNALNGGFLHGRSLSACCNALIELHEPDMQKMLTKAFVRVNKEAIEAEKLPGMPVHTPQCFGGLGLPGNPDRDLVLYFESEDNRQRLSKALSGCPRMYYMEHYLNQLPVGKGPTKKKESFPGMSYFIHAAEPVDEGEVSHWELTIRHKYQKLVAKARKARVSGPMPAALPQFRFEDQEFTCRASPTLLRMGGESVNGC